MNDPLVFVGVLLLVFQVVLVALMLEAEKKRPSKWTSLDITGPLLPTAYCASCRKHFEVQEVPPYGVIHRVSDGKHFHPITREEIT